jgi:uncharacterized membrane protein YcaP (DUF421 family)
VFVVALLRVTGKRTLARMNVFDLVVTVALGSILAMTILSGTTSLVQGLFAIAVLAGLEYVLQWLSAKDPRIRQLITSEPSLLFHRGEFLHRAMKAQRVSEDDVRTAIRQKGFANFEDVEAVVLENNGDLSVIARSNSGSASVLGAMGEGSR